MKLARLALGVVLGGALVSVLTMAGAAAWASALSAGRIFGEPDAPAHDVAIVFGAQVYADGVPAPFTAARLDLALRLYTTGQARVLLVSGNNAPEHNRETTAMRRYLEERGVPASRIVEDPWGQDTYDTCIRARDTYGVTSALLVSQTYHLPRAVATCQALGVDAVGVGDDSVQHLSFWPVGVMREYPADVNLVLDVARRRPPAVADPPSTAVADALRT